MGASTKRAGVVAAGLLGLIMAVVLNETFESGATLASLGFVQVIDASNQSGEGLGGSTWGVRGTGSASEKYYAEFSYPVATPARGFRVRITVDHADLLSNFGGYGLIELRGGNPPYGVWYLSLQHGTGGDGGGHTDNDLVLRHAASIDPNLIIGVASGVTTPGSAQVIEMWGCHSSDFDDNGNPLPDGSVNVSVDGDTVLTITNLALSPGGITSAWERWQSVAFGTMGRADNAYIDTDYDCSTAPSPSDPPADLPPAEQCCSTAGPGGSFTGADGSVTPIGPRVVPPQSTDPWYTPCSSGGTLAASSDPTDPQDVSASLSPIVHLAFTPADASVQRWATQPISTPNRAPISAKVPRGGWGKVPMEVMADRQGNLPSPEWNITLAEVASEIRAWLATTNRYMLGRFGQVYIEDDTARRAGTGLRKLAAGFLKTWKFTGDLTAQLTFANPLAAKRSTVRLDRPVPDDVVTRLMFPGAADYVLGRAIPIGYGEMSDDRDWSLDPSRTPLGLMTAIHVGRAHLLNMVNRVDLGTFASQAWESWVICKGASAGFQSWFMSNVDRTAAPQTHRMPTTTADVDILIPGYGSDWAVSFGTDSFVDLQDANGVVRRYTMVFTRGPRSDDAVAGIAPVLFNMCFREDVGDGTGDCIIDLPWQIAHFICYELITQYKTGVWGSIPAYPDTTPKFNRTSVVTCSSALAARVTGGYEGAWVVGMGGEQRPGSDWLTDLQRDTTIKVTLNHFTQVGLFAFDYYAATNSLVTFDDRHIKEGSWEFNTEAETLLNARTFDYGPEPSTGRNTGAVRRIVSSISVQNYGEVYEDTTKRTLWPVRVQAVAEDIESRILLDDDDVRYTGSFQTNLRGTNLSAGQLVRVTSERGLGPDGWLSRILMVTNTWLDPNDGVDDSDGLLTTVEWEDVHELMSASDAATSFLVSEGISVSSIGPLAWQPIGSSSLGTSQPIGSSAAGTSRRLG